MSLPLPPPLLPGRVHEAQGVAAVSFAAMQAGVRDGRLLWIAARTAGAPVMPPGLARFLAPERLVAVSARAAEDLLWATEEALRAGVAELVVAEPLGPLGLTAGRRLQLAAKAGGSTGLLLIRPGDGSPAAETRWEAAPLPDDDPDSTLAVWSLIKNKRGTSGHWTVRWDDAARAVTVVSAAGERPPAAGHGGP